MGLCRFFFFKSPIPLASTPDWQPPLSVCLVRDGPPYYPLTAAFQQICKPWSTTLFQLTCLARAAPPLRPVLCYPLFRSLRQCCPPNGILTSFFQLQPQVIVGQFFHPCAHLYRFFFGVSDQAKNTTVQTFGVSTFFFPEFFFPFRICTIRPWIVIDSGPFPLCLVPTKSPRRSNPPHLE